MDGNDTDNLVDYAILFLGLALFWLGLIFIMIGILKGG